jgi:hypothetical protein
MIEVNVTIDVTAPPAEVFAFWSDHSNNPQWQTGQRSCVWTSEPPIRVGSTYDQEAALFGRPIISSFECVDYEPGSTIRMKTTKSTLPLDITRTVLPGPKGGTTLNATIRGEPRGLMRVLNPLARRMVKRNIEKDYARLKMLFDRNAGTN